MRRPPTVTLLGIGVALAISGCMQSVSEPTTTRAPAPLTPTTIGVAAPSAPSLPPPPPPSTTVPSTTVPLSELTLVLTVSDTGFERPVLLVADPAGGADYVVEQPGRVVRADGADHEVVLDITDDVRFGGEQGMLGLAFHPEFASNQLAYVNYTDDRGRTVIEQFAVVDGMFDVESRRVILTIGQPAKNHNGGMIAFGPDGYLWIGMGDGGASNDRFGNGQDPRTLLGSMLRIAVPNDGSHPYAVPAGNPFADGTDGAPEVYAIGLRNPWRFSFDGGSIWIADVGQSSTEEVNRVSAAVGGINFGWPILEGSSCFRDESCDRTGLTGPVTQYGHDEGCSITGGYVYRGSAIAEIDGHYFFSDFCSGFLRSYSPGGSTIDWTDSTGPVPSPSGFGVGGDGELYVVSHEGTIYVIERST